MRKKILLSLLIFTMILYIAIPVSMSKNVYGDLLVCSVIVNPDNLINESIVIDGLTESSDYTLKDISYYGIEVPENHYFEGWKIEDMLYDVGDTITIKKDLIITAKWKADEHTFDYQRTLSKATLTEDGVIEEYCPICGAVGGSITILHPETFKISKKSFTYNKKIQKPTIKVLDSDNVTIANENYDVIYPKGCKSTGEYKVTIKFKGSYEGTKNLTYKIVPKGTSIKRIIKGKKSFRITWKKQTTKTTGYELMYSTSSKFKSGNKTVKIKSNKITSKKISKLKAKKKYYVKIRTYKTVNGKKFYSGWSKVKTVTTKK